MAWQHHRHGIHACCHHHQCHHQCHHLCQPHPCHVNRRLLISGQWSMSEWTVLHVLLCLQSVLWFLALSASALEQYYLSLFCLCCCTPHSTSLLTSHFSSSSAPNTTSSAPIVWSTLILTSTPVLSKIWWFGLPHTTPQVFSWKLNFMSDSYFDATYFNCSEINV